MTEATTLPSPESLQELFDKDPMELTRVDRNIIVAKLRADRLSWQAEETQAKAQGRRAKSPARPIKKVEDLDELGL